jgi:membrane protein DedA with SNARE-associated domain
MESIPFWLAHYGYAGLAVLLTLGIIGLPIPDETLLAFAGHLIAKGKLALIPTIGTAFLGSVCGITISYALGRWAGHYFIGKSHRIWRIERLEKVRDWFAHRGKLLLFFGYFVPGVRHVTAFVAGSSRLHMAIFGLFAYTGALFWCVSFIILGYFLQEGWRHLSVTMHKITIVGGLVSVVASLMVFLLRRRQCSAPMWLSRLLVVLIVLAVFS